MAELDVGVVARGPFIDLFLGADPVDLTDIKALAEDFLEWPDERRVAVSYVSAMLFARHVMHKAFEQQREAIAQQILTERGMCASDSAAQALAEMVRSGS